MSNKKDSISVELNKAVQEAEKHNSWFSNSNILNALSYWENKLNKNDFVGVIFMGIIIRGETSHYDLVTQETFRSIGSLAENYCDIAIINNVLCVENEKQLIERLEKNTKNNTNALINLIDEKSV